MRVFSYCHTVEKRIVWWMVRKKLKLKIPINSETMLKAAPQASKLSWRISNLKTASCYKAISDSYSSDAIRSRIYKLKNNVLKLAVKSEQRKGSNKSNVSSRLKRWFIYIDIDISWWQVPVKLKMRACVPNV